MKRKGYTVEVNLDKYGYNGYSVECTYKYNRKKEKYLLRMGLVPRDTNKRIRIEFNGIDTQYISGSKNTIEYNIHRIIEQAAIHHEFFDEYIKQYEYECKCFDLGNEILEREHFNKLNNDN